jgi:hypothetical protein
VPPTWTASSRRNHPHRRLRPNLSRVGIYWVYESARTFAGDPTTDELRPTIDDEIKVPMRPAAYQTPRADIARTGVQLQMGMAYRTFRTLRDVRLEPGMRTQAGVRQRLCPLGCSR